MLKKSYLKQLQVGKLGGLRSHRFSESEYFIIPREEIIFVPDALRKVETEIRKVETEIQHEWKQEIKIRI